MIDDREKCNEPEEPKDEDIIWPEDPQHINEADLKPENHEYRCKENKED